MAAARERLTAGDLESCNDGEGREESLETHVLILLTKAEFAEEWRDKGAGSYTLEASANKTDVGHVPALHSGVVDM